MTHTPFELASIAAALCQKDNPTDAQLMNALDTARRLLALATPEGKPQELYIATETLISRMYSGANARALFADFFDRNWKHIPSREQFTNPAEYIAYHGEQGWSPKLCEAIEDLRTRLNSESNRRNAAKRTKARKRTKTARRSSGA